MRGSATGVLRSQPHSWRIDVALVADAVGTRACALSGHRTLLFDVVMKRSLLALSFCCAARAPLDVRLRDERRGRCTDRNVRDVRGAAPRPRQHAGEPRASRAGRPSLVDAVRVAAERGGGAHGRHRDGRAVRCGEPDARRRAPPRRWRFRRRRVLGRSSQRQWCAVLLDNPRDGLRRAATSPRQSATCRLLGSRSGGLRRRQRHGRSLSRCNFPSFTSKTIP